MATCGTCSGSGSVNNGGLIFTCPACGGSGKTPDPKPPPPKKK